MSSEIEYNEFASEVYGEFNSLSDFIWKITLQLNEIKNVELQKLIDYYPDDYERQAIRWLIEGPKHATIFPQHLHYSNTVLVFITVETNLLKLCDDIRNAKSLSESANDIHATGMERYLKYLYQVEGIHRSSVMCWPQIANLRIIRNCIVHSNGYVNLSRDQQKLRKMINETTFLSEFHKANFKKNNRDARDELNILRDGYGDKLYLGERFAHIYTNYARKFFEDIFVKIGYAKLV